MIHKHIKSLPHHPKRVIIISLILALAIGIFGYAEINKTPATTVVPVTNTDTDIASAQNLTLGFLVGGRIASVSVKAGDMVTKGETLATLDAGNAEGALSQAKAAYAIAQANYQKIINGATGSAIDVAKAAVNAAQVNLDGVTKQQKLLVANADTNTSITPPSITGTYTEGTEGTLTFTVNQTGNTGYITFSGLASGTADASTTVPEPIGNTGLYIEFSSIAPYAGTTWNINIPNTNAANYLANYNAYQSALQTQSQAVANAQSALDQANASLSALVSAARPEDVATAQAQVSNAEGAVQIAEAALQNTIITAPADGTVVSVTIAPGQIAMPNAPAIIFTSNSVAP